MPSATDINPGDDGRPYIAIEKNYIGVWTYGDFEMRVNKVPVKCGYQRQPDPRPSIQLETWLSAQPQDVYALWTNAEALSQAFGSPVIKEQNTEQFELKFVAYERLVEWTTISKKPYSELYQFWRSADFPGEAPNSHVKIDLEEQAGGTQLTIQHSYLPIRPQKDWRAFWDEYILEPMRKYFQSLKGGNPK